MSKPAFVVAVALSFAPATVAGCAVDASQEEEGVGESQDHLLAGPRLAPAAVAGYLRRAGFPESAVGKMVCTAKWESLFYERATNKNHNGTTDYGLFQINSIHLRDGAGCPSSSAALFDPAVNARCALHVYESQGINAWYGYQKHRAECNAARAPASTGGGGGGGGDGAGGPSVSADAGGGCWSATLGDMVDAGTCVQSASNGIFYQCHDGTWQRGVAGGAGPFGHCTSSHPL